MKPCAFTQDAPREFAAMNGSRPRVANLAAKYLRKHGETVEDWDGVCGELADAIIGPDDDIIYVEGEIGWRFHMVPLVGGLIHDAWCEGDALPLRDWLAKMFGASWVEVSQNGDAFYEGLANEFQDGNDQAHPTAAKASVGGTKNL
jgi:hypothetical protein